LKIIKSMAHYTRIYLIVCPLLDIFPGRYHRGRKHYALDGVFEFFVQILFVITIDYQYPSNYVIHINKRNYKCLIPILIIIFKINNSIY